jgi:pyruvate/2-oxoglutarate dehydrogenase complex dihydrolipoamide acyltransferase (E2) component
MGRLVKMSKTTNSPKQSYTLFPFPRVRRAALDLAPGQRKHLIHALLEVDVTRARGLLAEYKARTGEGLSFTAFIITCLARAVEEHKSVQAYRKGRRKLIIFDNVDVSVKMEQEIEGERRAMFHIIRAANSKSVFQIHQEIRQAQRSTISTPGGGFGLRLYESVPSIIRRYGVWAIRRRPELWTHFAGTVSVTSLGMYGGGTGWGVPITSSTLGITIGTIGSKPGIDEQKQMSIREYLCLTVSVDHDIVDGAPAARFAVRLKELVESCYGLEC